MSNALCIVDTDALFLNPTGVNTSLLAQRGNLFNDQFLVVANDEIGLIASDLEN